MRSIWFKACYVEAILSGAKRETVRRERWARSFNVGDVVSFTIGPRPPFAFARITAVGPVILASLPAQKRSALHELYGNQDQTLWQIHFQLVADPR